MGEKSIALAGECVLAVASLVSSRLHQIKHCKVGQRREDKPVERGEEGRTLGDEGVPHSAWCPDRRCGWVAARRAAKRRGSFATFTLALAEGTYVLLAIFPAHYACFRASAPYSAERLTEKPLLRKKAKERNRGNH